MERVTEAVIRRQRTIQTTLLFIILATLPCYCVGFVLLGIAPQRTQRTPTIVAQTRTVTGSPASVTATLFASITPFPTGFAPPTSLPPLGPTPTQIRLITRTFTPIPPPTIIIIPPTFTPIIIIITNTPFPTTTPQVFTATPSRTSTPTLTATVFVPTPTPTRTTTPTLTATVFVPTPTPTATPTPTPTTPIVIVTFTPTFTPTPTPTATSTSTP